ncbi:MAG: aminopeptidase P family protein [Promethearchaeota archaeon]|nr:MAG: aminopeptidase P family protein [Candidatus Lokiarchaeota archaeon]
MLKNKSVSDIEYQEVEKTMSKVKVPRETHLKIASEKHEQLPAIMKKEKVDCWIIFARETDSTPDPVMDIVVAGDVVWHSAFIFSLAEDKLSKVAIVGNHDVNAEEDKRLWDEVIGYKEGISKPLADYIKKLDPKKIALNYSIDDVTSDGLTHGMFLTISEILKDKKDRFISAEPIIQDLRGRKSQTEIELVKEACILTKEIYEEMAAKLKVGMNEKEVQKMFHDKMDSLGVIEAWQRNSCPAVDAGPDKGIGHAGPKKDSLLKKGHTVHFDFGIKLHGYCSDIQRMYFFGKEEDIPEELQHAFDTVHKAITLAAEFIKPGVKGYEVDKIARDHVLERGYEEYTHALGHQVGTHAHDGGVLLGPLWERYGDIPKGEVQENMIFTLELYTKTKNYGYVSLEEDIVVTKDGCEFLIPRQDKFICIE